MYYTFGLFVLPVRARAQLFPSTATTLERQRLSASDLSTDQGADLSTDQGTDPGTDFVVFEIFMFFKPQKPEGIHLWK